MGGLGQLVIAFLGDAIGGVSVTVILLGVDACVAVAGAVLILRWSRAGLVLMSVAALAAVVALFWRQCTLACNAEPIATLRL
jgi:hypothetical protein